MPCSECGNPKCVCALYPMEWDDHIEERITQIRKHEMSEKAKTDKSNTGLVLIPFYSILRIGRIFVEGLRYGRDNWKKGVGDQEFQEERLEHALLHLIKWKEGDRTEDHLAKVAWFCVTQMELERLEIEAIPLPTMLDIIQGLGGK